jgi:pimeloyl-ACP methyl ester carboxylesterase
VSLFSFLSVTIYTVAPTQLFYPHFDADAYDILKSNSNVEELAVMTDNGVLSGWLYHHAEDGAPLVLYFCGNGENAAARVRKLIDNDLLSFFDGYNIAVFDYPGYGKSSGTPSEKALKSAGLAAYDAVAQRADVDGSRIVVFGYSIGTGVADYVASERNVAGLMLMAPYADGYDLYNGVVNIFHGPLRLLVTFPMESVKFAGNIAVKPLILASESDKTVGYASSVRLSKAFPAGCTFQTIPDIGHNDFWGSQTVLQDIADYLKSANKKSTAD